jgi:hypothetical protein
MIDIPTLGVHSGHIYGNQQTPRYYFEIEQSDETSYLSLLNTPVYSPLEFKKVSGTSYDNSRGVNGQQGESEVILKIDTVLFNISQTKNIVKTSIQGRDFTIKEFISDGDFNISIKGAIMSQFPLVFPLEDVNKFIELMRLKKQLPVACDFLAHFSIDSIVVDSWSIAQRMGSRNEVPFSIEAVNEPAEELILNKNKNL